ncbi:MAG: TonB-dependent receptor, partial [Hyphomicrobiaceae bacterium]
DPSRDAAKLSSSKLAPNVTIMVEPFNGLQFYGLYKEGYRMPSSWELSRLSYALPFNPGAYDNLKPEHAKNYELGVNYLKDGLFTGSDKLRLKAAWFDNTIDDYIAKFFGTNPAGAVFVVLQNLPSARFRGAEFSAHYDAGGFFGQAAVTYYDKVEFCVGESTPALWNPLPAGCNGAGASSFDYSLNYVPPKYYASLTLGTRWFDEKLTLGGRLRYFSERAGEDVRLNNGQFAAAWSPWDETTLVDIFASYKFNDIVSLDFSMTNVFDRYYVEPLNLAAIPGPGRTASLTLTGKF